MYKELLKKIELTPDEPGCYLFKDSADTIIYIGKAKNLKRRVRQYFDKNSRHEPKIEVMTSQIADYDWVTVNTETEALVLESSLIKKYRPKYNSLQKDDKKYAWIKITNEPIPRIMRVRNKKRDGAQYFGPFPNGSAAKATLSFLRKLYPYRVCNKKMYYAEKIKRGRFKNENGSFRRTSKSRLCLDYHLELCGGPCDNLITKEAYQKNFEKINKFLNGKRKDLLKKLSSSMKSYALNQDFETAAMVRDQINELNYITQKINVRFGQDETGILRKQEKIAGKIALSLLKKLSISHKQQRSRIECYDVSNIQGTDAVASMVVFVNGKPEKKHYRIFNIKTKKTPDDYQMMREAVSRRVQYLIKKEIINLKNNKKDEGFSQMPDLIVVDGGKGQVGAAQMVLKKYNLNIPTVGIAKKEEIIIQKIGENFNEIRLTKDSKILHLIQNMRDEAHRFAISRHRNLRSKKSFVSILSEIPGIGDKTIEKLMKEFGSINEIKKADFDTIYKVLQNKSKSAAIINYFE